MSISGRFTKDHIINWLEGPIPTSPAGTRPAAGLRLICREQQDSMQWPFDKATFEAVQNVLGLPQAYSYFTMPKSGACGKYLGTAGQSRPRISIEDLCTKICSQFPIFAHPLMVPTILIELTATDLMRELYHINRLLTMSEYKTQSGDWEIQDSTANTDQFGAPNATPAVAKPHLLAEESSWHDEAAGEMLKEPSYWKKMNREMTECEDNFQLARTLGWLSCRFAFMNAAVECSISMTEFTLQEMDFMGNYVAPANRRKLKGIMNSADRVEFLASNLRHMAKFAAIEPRMQTQQTVLFNLINIGVARDSKEVAEASKRDSSAMKIIAVLTTLFLPGAFIATFFAMPIFNWDASSMTNVMKPHFWIYWAVAIPLTAFVMAVVGTFGILQARSNRKAAESARKKAGFRDV